MYSILNELKKEIVGILFCLRVDMFLLLTVTLFSMHLKAYVLVIKIELNVQCFQLTFSTWYIKFVFSFHPLHACVMHTHSFDWMYCDYFDHFPSFYLSFFFLSYDKCHIGIILHKALCAVYIFTG